MPLELVSTQTDADIRRAQATTDLTYRLRILGANMLRVMRGAGRPYSLISEMADVVQAVREVHDVAGTYPMPEVFANALDPQLAKNERNEWRATVDEATKQRWQDDGTFDREDADWEIIHGAMQIAASELLGQKPQEASGKREMVEGIHARAEAIAKMRNSLPVQKQSKPRISRTPETKRTTL